MIRLTTEHVILLHEELIQETGGMGGLRNEAMLDSALNAPFHTFSGVEVYPSIQHKAARLAFSLIQNHAFVDGNKRIGAHVMLVFLALNGIDLEYQQYELVDIVLKVAQSEANTANLLEWILEHQIG